jgi:nicotinamide-nucleotide amidase
MKDTPAPDDLDRLAASVLKQAKRRGFRVATAESCTGGLIGALLTDIDGMSRVFDRGFVVYSEEAKIEVLGLDPAQLMQKGAVSEWAARAMAAGALERSGADIVLAITGFAGPGGPGEEEGLVHMAAARRDGRVIHREAHYGPRGRADVRAAAAKDALDLMNTAMAPRREEEEER